MKNTLVPLLGFILLSTPLATTAQQSYYGDFAYTSDGSAITITWYIGRGGAVTIPSTINGLPVTALGWGVFNGDTGLTNVTIPSSVTCIGDAAFQGCTNLTSVTIPEKVTRIGSVAFLSCTKLTKATIGNGVTTIAPAPPARGESRRERAGLQSDQSLSDEQLNRLYNLFDVTVLPSTGEGFGLPIIESLAAGVPVVATDCSACSELVRGRGELVRVLTTVTVGTNLIEHAVIDVEDLARCIEKLYRNPKLAKQYSDTGLAFARSLNWESLTALWLQLIRSTTGREPSNMP